MMATIIDKVHCLFEQSGTFKNEFIKMGIPAEDYDLQNNFAQTDNVVDIFSEIDKAYLGTESIFSKIGGGDIVLAFFPCIYFSALSQMAFYPTCTNYRKLSVEETYKAILERNQKRARYYELFTKLFAIARLRGIRMIVENPYSEQTYLKANFEKPTLVDMDRTKRGDYYKKPTAYWFINIERTYGESYQRAKEVKTIMKAKMSGTAGVCSEERSMISSDYARNFINDFILGSPKRDHEQYSIF